MSIAAKACAILIALTLGIGATGSLRRAHAADIYGFDKGHTNISFSWNHMGLSRQSGRILDYDGTLEFDPGAPEAAKVEVTMKVASIATGVEALDKHLRTADFFDAEKHPTITFRSTAARKTGDKTGEVTGDLTIMGITKPITLLVTWNFTGEHPLAKLNATYRDKIVTGFSAKGTLLRSEWGVKRGAPLTSDEIQISIETELFKK